ncbi:MAG: hypothetical protein KatS3mg062_1071 [Tepidiforma sp.]|nr:MAG: hypothetical protein KatS3mg062_1071 [Tepidiforma sp.]
MTGGVDSPPGPAAPYTGPVTIGVLLVTLRLPSRSLKEKRSIVRPIVERLRNRFNAAIAEVGALDTVGESVIAAAIISNDPRHADAQLAAIAEALRGLRADAELVDIETDLIEY